MSDSPERRRLLSLAALLTMHTALAASPGEVPGGDHMRMMHSVPGDAPKIAILVHPEMVALDLIGPMTAFKIARFDVQLIWKDMSPCMTDVGLPICATRTFAQCPTDLDVLLVPGGIIGTVKCMDDSLVTDFLADRGSRAKWVTSVCTGGLLLAAAGLLNGYAATAHWAVADLLPLMGARHVDHRVVRDRNRMTAGGVTAGIDFALTLMAEMKDEELARRVALMMEYAPAPPLANGTPAQAGPERTAAMRGSRHWMDEQARLAALRAGARLGVRS